MGVQAKALSRSKGVARRGEKARKHCDEPMAQDVQGMWDFGRGTYPTAPDGAAPGHRRERVEPAVGDDPLNRGEHRAKTEDQTVGAQHAGHPCCLYARAMHFPPEDPWFRSEYGGPGGVRSAEMRFRQQDFPWMMSPSPLVAMSVPPTRKAGASCTFAPSIVVPISTEPLVNDPRVSRGVLQRRSDIMRASNEQSTFMVKVAREAAAQAEERESAKGRPCPRDARYQKLEASARITLIHEKLKQERCAAAEKAKQDELAQHDANMAELKSRKHGMIQFGSILTTGANAERIRPRNIQLI